jgi:hypothetical protein
MMMNNFDRLDSILDTIEWSRDSVAQKQINAFLSGFAPEQGAFWQQLKRFAQSQQTKLERLSVETPTHFKWLIYFSGEYHYRVWLHLYKPVMSRGSGYAIIPHNHRYSFTSLILRGGFCSTEYEIKHRDGSVFSECVAVKRNRLETGKIYTLSSESVHALSDFIHPCATLIVQNPPVKTYSESFNPGSGQISVHHQLSLDRFLTIVDRISN